MSAPANQVRLTASALETAHEYHHVDLMTGAQNEPAFRAVNPVGRVPALVDDGFHLGESNAIARYLALKSDSKLYQAPTQTTPEENLQKRAEIDQWMDFAAHHIRSNMGKVLFNKVFAPTFGMETNEKSMTEGVAGLDRDLPTLEAALEKSPYIAGAQKSIADIALLAAMEPFDMIGYDVSGFSHVDAWRKKLSAEPFYQNVHAHYAAEAPTS